MIYTLYTYIFRELLRVFLLAMIALTLILSLGSILQPIQHYGAGPRQVLVFMFYFLPIILTFVLPIAALFSGALVYGRFTSDNELDACRASGISIINLVVPGLVLAIVVAISNLFLSFYIMPTFVHLAEKSIKADIKQMLFRGIERNGYFKIDIPPDNKYLLYADYVDTQNDTLWGIVLTKVEGAELTEINTTESAKIKIIPHEQNNEVQIAPRKIYMLSPDHAVSLDSMVFTTEFGSLLADNISFKKIDEMRKIKADLMKFDPVAKKAKAAWSQLVTELLAFDFQNRIKGHDEVEQHENSGFDSNFYELPGDPNSVKFSFVPYTIMKEQIDFAGDITFIEYNASAGENLRTFKCKEASLRIEGNGLEPDLTMSFTSAIDMENGEIEMWHTVSGLNIPKNIQKILNQFINDNGSINVQKLSAQITDVPGFKASSILTERQGSLEREIQVTETEMRSELHSRLVFGIGCIAMIMIGIAIGIIKKGGHLLSAFGASCVPAAILVVCIISGKQLTENLGAQTVSGITIMWGGLGALCILVLVLYYYLLKN